MSTFNFLKADRNKKTQGVWIEKFGGEYRIGSPNALEITRCLEKHTKIKVGKRKDYQLKSSEQFVCQIEVMLELKLMDWRNVKDVNGDPVKFTHDVAFNALISDMDYVLKIDEDGEAEFDENSEYKTLFQWVNEEADLMANYEKDAKEKTAKKSQSSSTGRENQS